VYDDLLQEFIESLNKGEFRLPICNSCKVKVWPPSPYCPQCLSNTSLQIIDEKGILIHFTQSYLKGMEGCYGLVEMSGIKLIGSFESLELKEGLKVKMVRCGVSHDGTPYYLFEPIKG
jgi:uncharacterized OB-fold protein